MPFVKRNAEGAIVKVCEESADESLEFVSASDQELLDFLRQGSDAEAVRLALRDSDPELARVTEDLIHLLVKKQVILFTDLPEIVQQKLLAREQIRACLKPITGSILSEDETI